MNNKRNKVFIAVFLLAILLVGCKYVNSGKSRIFDDNNRIASSQDSYSFYNRKGNTSKDKISITFDKFYGMDTIYRINVNDKSLIHIQFDAKISKGEFKVVLIDSNDTIEKILEDTVSGEMRIPLEKGVNRIKMVGREADGELLLQLDIE